MLLAAPAAESRRLARRHAAARFLSILSTASALKVARSLARAIAADAERLAQTREPEPADDDDKLRPIGFRSFVQALGLPTYAVAALLAGWPAAALEDLRAAGAVHVEAQRRPNRHAIEGLYAPEWRCAISDMARRFGHDARGSGETDSEIDQFAMKQHFLQTVGRKTLGCADLP